MQRHQPASEAESLNDRTSRAALQSVAGRHVQASVLLRSRFVAAFDDASKRFSRRGTQGRRTPPGKANWHRAGPRSAQSFTDDGQKPQSCCGCRCHDWARCCCLGTSHVSFGAIGVGSRRRLPNLPNLPCLGIEGPRRLPREARPGHEQTLGLHGVLGRSNSEADFGSPWPASVLRSPTKYVNRPLDVDRFDNAIAWSASSAS
jgi:hypothetical protein